MLFEGARESGLVKHLMCGTPLMKRTGKQKEGDWYVRLWKTKDCVWGQ